METYTDIIFTHNDKYEEYIEFITYAARQFDSTASLKELGTKNGQVAIHIFSGIEGLQINEIIFQYFKKVKMPFARGFIAGDEDPFCVFYFADDGKPSKTKCDPEVFEYIRDNIDDAPDGLKDIIKQGASSYFNFIYDRWHEGQNDFENQQDYKSTIDQVISYSD